MITLQVFILLLVLVVEYVLSCRGGYYYDDNKAKEMERFKQIYKSLLEKKARVNQSEFPWDMTDDQLRQYGQWYDKYKKSAKLNWYKETQGASPPGMRLPKEWQNYGTGTKGQNPPPWATHKDNYPKGIFCYYHKDAGNKICGQNWTRWGFNRFTQKCEIFYYYGCEGNTNNFVSERRCKESCIDIATSNCCKYGEYVEY